MISPFRSELGAEHGPVERVAPRLGYRVESVRSWVLQPDIDAGVVPWVRSSEATRVQEL